MNPEPEHLRPSPSSREQVHPPEFLGKGKMGLQARLLVGDLTTPALSITKKQLRPVNERGAQGITKEAGEMYQGSSLSQRRRHQQETGLTYTRWKEGFTTYLESIRQDTTRGERKEFLERIGITDSVTADDFYNEYLKGTSDVIKFVDDVETQTTHKQIQQHQDILRNLGNAFGYESSEVIEHLIHGVRNVKSDINGFIKEAKKTANTSEVLTNPLFQHIQEDSSEEKTRQQPKPSPQPTKVHYAPTPVKRVDLDEEPESPVPKPAKKAVPEKAPPASLEFKPQPKVPQTQVFPAPVERSDRTDTPLSDDELREAIKYLLFNNSFSPRTEDQAAFLRGSERVRYYVKELHAMMQEYGSDFVLEKAVTAVLFLNRDLLHVGLKSDNRSKKQSWYLWGIAKSRFLANNPDIQQTLPNAEKYEPFDPLLHYQVGIHSFDGRQSKKAEDDIQNGMLGWEVYRQRKKIDDIIFHLNPLMAPAEKKRLRELLALPPKKDVPTLSSYQLQEIGRLVRINIKRE